MTPEEIRTLYEYNSWANHLVLDACEPLTAEQFTREIESSFRSVRDTLVHIMAAEWIWLERWHGRMPKKLLSEEVFPTVAAVRERWGHIEKGLHDFVGGLKQEDLERQQTIENTAGKIFTHTQQEMLQHVVNHGSYHRGQMTTLLRQAGAKPVYTDLIAFYRERGAKAAS